MSYCKTKMWGCFVFSIAACFISQSSFAFLGTDEFDISSFCNKESARRTIVYIDDQAMEAGNTAWANRIFQKIRGSLMPNEPVQVVQMSTRNNTAKEIWSACWPDYPPAEKSDILSQRSWFSKQPGRVLESQQGMFLNGLASSMTYIYNASKQSRAGSVAEQPIRPKSVVKVLLNDESRIHVGRSTLRLIIYSDFTDDYEQSKDKKSIDYIREGVETVARAKFSLNGASVYLFGEAGSEDESEKTKEIKKKFWVSFVKAAGGFLIGYGSDLNLPANQAVQFLRYDVEVMADQTRFGSLRLFFDSKGQLQDSSLYFSPEHSSAIEGTFICGVGNKCSLIASTLEGTITMTAGEEIKISGDRENMRGTLGFQDDRVQEYQQRRALFDLSATLR